MVGWYWPMFRLRHQPFSGIPHHRRRYQRHIIAMYLWVKGIKGSQGDWSRGYGCRRRKLVITKVVDRGVTICANLHPIG